MRRLSDTDRSHLILFLAASALIEQGACRSKDRNVDLAVIRSDLSTVSLQVLYANGDPTAPNDNQVKPHLKIKNTGTIGVGLSTLTARYWYTVESGSPEQIWVDFAAVGNTNVTGRVVRLQGPATGADRYLEISFLSAAGSVASGSDTGEIQMRVNKTDWTVYDETNDYSYQSTASFVIAPRITLYQNGALIWGTEPTPVRSCDTGVHLQILYSPGDPTAPNDNQIKPHLQVVNTGFADVPLREVRVRYWFTRDGTAPEQAWLDYARLGSAAITMGFASPPIETSTADRFLEVGFTDGAGILLAGASTGEIQVRFNKTDWSPYNETNDYSYDGTHPGYLPSTTITASRNGLLLSAQEPTPSAAAPGQTVFVEATLLRAPGGTVSSIPGRQSFSSPTPFAVPQTMPVSAGNLGNQNVSLVLTTGTGIVTCSYRGAASLPSPTIPEDVALGRIAAFGGCDQACPSIGDAVFVTGILLRVLGADPAQAQTTVTLHLPSPNEPVAVATPIDDNDPAFRKNGDPAPPQEPGAISEGHLPGPPVTVHPVPDLMATFTTNPLEVGYVDTIDPTIIFVQ